jgi:putative addiction module killer protein
MYEIKIYKNVNGKELYTEWIEGLDNSVRARIRARFARIRETGNLGVCEPVGEGVFELKLDFGPGYRVYFGYNTETNLILLLGGFKKSQQKDIEKSIDYWKEHLSIQKRGKK